MSRYAGFNVVAFVMILFWVPETKQHTLEELDWVFALPTSRFARYQVQKAIPYFVRRWVFFDRKATLEPLYTFEKSRRAENVVETKNSSDGEKKSE